MKKRYMALTAAAGIGGLLLADKALDGESDILNKSGEMIDKISNTSDKVSIVVDKGQISREAFDREIQKETPMTLITPVGIRLDNSGAYEISRNIDTLTVEDRSGNEKIITDINITVLPHAQTLDITITGTATETWDVEGIKTIVQREVTLRQSDLPRTDNFENFDPEGTMTTEMLKH